MSPMVSWWGEKWNKQGRWRANRRRNCERKEASAICIPPNPLSSLHFLFLLTFRVFSSISSALTCPAREEKGYTSSWFSITFPSNHFKIRGRSSCHGVSSMCYMLNANHPDAIAWCYLSVHLLDFFQKFAQRKCGVRVETDVSRVIGRDSHYLFVRLMSNNKIYCSAIPFFSEESQPVFK